MKRRRKRFKFSQSDFGEVVGHRKYVWVRAGKRSPAAQCVARDPDTAWRMLVNAVLVRKDRDGTRNETVKAGWDLSRLTLKDKGRARRAVNYWVGIWPENAPKLRIKP